jgi:hypothetical protein
MLEASTSEPNRSAPQLTIEMCRQNIVIRPTAAVDEGYTVALTDAVNAAALTDTVVIIDPESVRCDDAIAGDENATAESRCANHDECEPVDAEVVNSRMIRIATERDSWTIDLQAGRLCQAAATTHHLHHAPEAWVPIVAIAVTRSRLSALTTEGALITSSRAHRAA